MKYQYGSRRSGKTLAAVEVSKRAQGAGKRVLWATDNQTATAALLAKHGALSEIIGGSYVAPRFRTAPPTERKGKR